MKIPLQEFEHLIEEKIIKRGLSYFKKGHITDVSEISAGEYEAEVSGTEEYVVRLEIKQDTIVEHHCDCPYDMGPVCKHIVAVIFHLQQDVLGFNEPASKKPRKKRTKSVAQQVKELLKAISHEDLQVFIGENCKKDKNFRNYFLASFSHLTDDHSKELYQKQIHSILKSAAGRDGWIDWSEMKIVVKAMNPFIINANNYFENGNYENVFYISTAMLEEINEALQYGDDSNGDLGSFIDFAMSQLRKLTLVKVSETLKKEIVEYCITTFEKKLFEGWDWHLGILQIANETTNNQQEVDRILGCLYSVNGTYTKEHAQSLILEVLRHHKRDKEAQNFADKFISNSSIREEEIERAFNSKNYNRAKELSLDGIRCDEKERGGLVRYWWSWLLKIAQAEKDTDNSIKYARLLLIRSNFNSVQEYYGILKKNIPKKEWHPFLEKIIKELPTTKWGYPELIRTIYINENWWDRLFNLLQKYPSLDNIEKEEQYLSKDYSSELIELYHTRLLLYVENYVGRSHYKTACKYLRRMKKLGGNNNVTELVAFFRQQYPQRRALMDELSRV